MYIKLIKELNLKDEEVARLSQIRDEVGAELKELTASLFELAKEGLRSIKGNSIVIEEVNGKNPFSKYLATSVFIQKSYLTDTMAKSVCSGTMKAVPVTYLNYGPLLKACLYAT
ncbi:uncharacterized protein LOC143245515 [Tachypleus tridentatus]|uniref:uncharacterized protein LOC143245515 n=1 Tax=Tachypleus tridentatus TaxID=6853 RepID=UPI003FD57B97